MATFKMNPNAMKEIHTKLKVALVEASKVLQQEVKTNAPVATGALEESIDINTDKIETLTTRVGTDIDYADYVEFGTSRQAANPYFRSAIRSAKRNMLDKFKGIL